jgi:hypothetical protein
MMEIIVHYFDLHTDFIYEQHSNIFENERSLKELSCIVIGREIKRIVGDNEFLFRRITNFLSDQLKDTENSAFIRLLRQADKSNSMDDVISYSRLLLQGLGDSSPSQNLSLK